MTLSYEKDENDLEKMSLLSHLIELRKKTIDCNNSIFVIIFPLFYKIH